MTPYNQDLERHTADQPASLPDPPELEELPAKRFSAAFFVMFLAFSPSITVASAVRMKPRPNRLFCAQKML